VKLLRRILFNWRYRKARVDALGQGPGGALVENAVMANEGDDRKVYLTKPRDGAPMPFEIHRKEGQFGIEEIRPRYRADLAAMADRAAARGVKLVFAGYLAGLDAGFRELREVMRYYDGYKGALYADCSAVLPEILNATKNAAGTASRPEPWSMERVHALRSLVLTADRHPTALGYEVEARTIAKKLQEAGLLDRCTIESGAEFLRRQDVHVPWLEREPGPAIAYRYQGEPGDRVAVVFGVKGSGFCDGLELPFDHRPILERLGQSAASSLVAVAGADGWARIEIPPAIAGRLADARYVACLVQRGGRGGAARMLLSRVLEIRN
jgi:hypothetical protein